MAELLQVIRDDGSTDASLDPRLTEDDAVRLYRYMVTERILDERMLGLQRSGRIGFYGPSIGQEAAIVPPAFATAKDDWVFPQYREPGAALVRGMPLFDLICQFMGNAKDLVRGHQMPCHYAYRRGNFMSISSCVGTQIPAAVGAAWAMRIRGERNATLVYFGDGATSTGDFHVGLNFAGVFKAPAVLLCNNNQYAISLRVDRQTASETLAQKARAYGFDGVRVDGMDALATYRATRDALERARNGGGPTLIEALTYRLGPHSSSDDPSRYRPDAEAEAWRQRDPLLRFRRYLVHRGIWSDADEVALEKEVGDAITEAVHEAERVPPPPVESLFEDVYGTAPPQLREQMAGLLALGGK